MVALQRRYERFESCIERSFGLGLSSVRTRFSEKAAATSLSSNQT